MSIYAVPNVVGCIVIFTIGLVVFMKNTSSKMNMSFFAMCLLIFTWLAAYAVSFSTSDIGLAKVCSKIAGSSASMTTACLYMFYACFMGKYDSEKKYIYLSFISMAVLLPFFAFTDMFLTTPYKYSWGYYSRAGSWHPFYLVIFFAIWFKGLAMFLDKSLWLPTNPQKNINKYIMAMYLIIILGLVDYIPKYGIDVYPFGWVALVGFAALFAYGIIKYRFLNITLAITRTSIFVAVYSIVLGIPFGLEIWVKDRFVLAFGGIGKLFPMFSLVVFATVGPFIYLYLQKKAEDSLLQEQRQYQSTLRQASLGMGQIKDLKRLLDLIVHVVTRAVKIENCKIFLKHVDSNKYILKAAKGGKQGEEGYNFLDGDSPLVKYFTQMKEPIVTEEIARRQRDSANLGFEDIEEILKKIDAALVVPSFIEQKLIAIISLGKKRSGKLYSHDDLAVFSILANQSALAIENAQFYEDMQRTHVQLLKAEKMATVGTMADGLSHQINNRLHAMGFIAGDLIDTIQFGKKAVESEKDKIMLEDIETGLLRIQENVKHGGEIVGGLLRYTRKGEQGFTAVEFDKLLDSAFEMVQFKIKISALDVKRRFESTLPPIRGNFTQLQEVFFNLIDNAYDAMMQRKDEMSEEGYQATLEILARKVGDKMEILIQDNGMGVKESDMHKLFTPFFTTKATSEKGTGLGLYVIRQIIEDNHGGKVNFSSKYQIGSETQILLPLATEKVG